MDAELSPLVQRSFSLVSVDRFQDSTSNSAAGIGVSNGTSTQVEPSNGELSTEEKTVLRTVYRAATNRMLRVSVNGFFESMGVVLGVMQELDVDVLAEEMGGTET